MLKTLFQEGFPGTLVPCRDGFTFVPTRLGDVLPSIPIDAETVKANDNAVFSLGQLRLIVPTLPNSELLTVPFMRREAVLSSRIEGTRTEIPGLFLFEEMRAESSEFDKSIGDEADAQEVLNYVLAQKIGWEMIRSLPLCFRVLSAMHQQLMENLPRHRGFDKMPGQYRKTPNFIGGETIANARFAPPPREMIDDLMSDLELFINSENHLPRLINTAICHYQFETIHPFFDGNGRIGRLLVLLQLSACGFLDEPLLYLSAFFQRNKEEYISRLQRVSTHGEWKPWILFFLSAVEFEANDAARRSQKLLALREEQRARLQSAGAAGKTLELVDSLFRWPVITVKRAQELLGLETHQGASKHISILVDNEIIREATGFTRNRRFVASELLSILE
jgi:Fic family protein